MTNEGEGEGRYALGPEQELSQADQRHLKDTSAEAVDATEPDEEEVLRESTGSPTRTRYTEGRTPDAQSERPIRSRLPLEDAKRTGSPRTPERCQPMVREAPR